MCAHLAVGAACSKGVDMVLGMLKSRAIVWFSQCNADSLAKLSRKPQQKSPLKVSAEYSVYLLRKQQKKKTINVFSQEHRIHPPLARWQRVPTAHLTEAFTNGHQPRENLRNDSSMNTFSDSNIIFLGVENYPNPLWEAFLTKYIFIVINFFGVLTNLWPFKIKALWIIKEAPILILFQSGRLCALRPLFALSGS